MICPAQHLHEALSLAVGDLLRQLHAARADAARRIVDDARQPQVVRGRRDHAEVGQHVLDLSPVEKARAADDAVRDAVALEGVLKLVGLGVHAIQHRMIPPVGALAVISQNG